MAKEKIKTVGLEELTEEKSTAVVAEKTQEEVLNECIATLEKGLNEHISRSELFELKTKLEGLIK